MMKLVGVEGRHTLQTMFSLLDFHVGQSYSFLITAKQPAKDNYVVVSSRFTSKILTTTGVLHYINSSRPFFGPISTTPDSMSWSISHAEAKRTNLITNGPMPNQQGSYHYGMINITNKIRLATYAGQIKGKQRYAVNQASFYPTYTPLKLSDFEIDGIYKPGRISDQPTKGEIFPITYVMHTDYRAFVEVAFENLEDIVQSWHLDGYSFFFVGLGLTIKMELGKWSSASRKVYNLNDVILRCTIQTAEWVSEIMDCDIHIIGQHRNVEHEIRVVRKTILWTAVLHVCLHNITCTSLRDE